MKISTSAQADNVQFFVTSLLEAGKEEIKVKASFKYQVVDFHGDYLYNIMINMLKLKKILEIPYL